MTPASLACPNCGAAMARRSDPDVSYEECPTCGGLFLDAGELNQLATGLSGDIEFITIDAGRTFADTYPPRVCPRCREAMKKEDLLLFTSVIFDHCGTCGGWFLDRAELPAMNRLLNERRETRGGARDARAERRGHWTTITRTTDVYAYSGGGIAPTLGIPVQWTQISVFFRHPLAGGLCITPETWIRRLGKLFGARDVRIGDADFDRTFFVAATDPTAAATALPPAGRKALLTFAASPLAKLGYKRTWKVLGDRIAFTFTDWGRENRRPTEADETRLLDALIDVADALAPAA